MIKIFLIILGQRPIYFEWYHYGSNEVPIPMDDQIIQIIVQYMELRKFVCKNLGWIKDGYD